MDDMKTESKSLRSKRAQGSSGELAIGKSRGAQSPAPCSVSLDGSLGYAIRKAQICAYQTFSVYMREMNIRPAQFALLALIYENPGVMQSVTGTVLGIEKANLAGLLTELQQLGAVKRRSPATDRRAYSLNLTASGRKLVGKLLQRHEEYEIALSSNLSPKDRDNLLRLLAKLVQG